MSTSNAAELMPGPADVTSVPEESAQRPAPPAAPLPRHPAVVGALVGLPLLAFAIFGFEPEAFITAFTAAVLVALAAIDLAHRVLPNRIVLPAIAVVLAAQVAFFPDRALEWALAGLAAAAFLALPLILRRDAMGMGDIKLGMLLGVATGWPVFGVITIGCLAMLPVALWLLTRDGSIRNAAVPFGPFLTFGALVVMYTP